MDFKEFKGLQLKHVAKMLEKAQVLFTADVDKDALWDTYLTSFPPGTNEVFRQRREYDCSCCRHFIRSFGNVVAVIDGEIVTIWDFATGHNQFEPVVEALADKAKSTGISDVFVTKEAVFGTDKSHEQLADGTVVTWNHFGVKLPDKFVSKSDKTVPSLIGEYRDVRNVFKRSLEEISKDAIETVLDLISQKSLYKGEEWQGALTKFLELHNEYHNLPAEKRDVYCWTKSVEVGGAIGKIRNHSIGTLLIDLSVGVDVNEAVRKYEAIVAPTNYKRPKAIFTPKMVEQAQKTLEELGLLNALGRRFAAIEDITVNNILFANRGAAKKMKGDVFAELKKDVATSPKSFDKVDEVSIEHFVEHILPRTTKLEVFFESKLSGNLVSLIAPLDMDSKPLFKWSNGFSWAYNGNIADSMKERVKSMGGNVNGVIRFSLQWNDNGDNDNDFDAHCIEPGRNEIFFGSKNNYRTTGTLDVDIIDPVRQIANKTAVENITWSDINRMEEGLYVFAVHNYNDRGGKGGFSAEIEHDGQVYAYEYPQELRHKETVVVAKLKFNKRTGIEFVELLPSRSSSKDIWGIKTNQFHPVTVCMYSPNYWDEQSGIGHKHYFFMLDGCKTDDRPNGFFNEFLREDFMLHKRVFEALGSKMQVEQSDKQLSGLGFSSTQRNSIVVKVEGAISRIIKITF